MNSIAETARGIDASQRKAVKVAGFMFLFCLIAPLLNWVFIFSKFIVADNAIATAKNILANEWLFRFGMTFELAMAVGLIVLATALYVILKPINRNLALLALCLKLAEAVIVAVIVLISYIALQFLDGAAQLSAFTPEQLQASAGFLLNVHTVLYAIPMAFLGLDLVIFFYLFFKSKYIPRILSGLGILSYSLIFIHSMLYLLAPHCAKMSIMEIICYSPSCLAEIVIGLWLLIKGINIQP